MRLDTVVSLYPNIYAIDQGAEVSLLKVLTTEKYRGKIHRLRISDPHLQTNLKLQLPCFTPTGVFQRRVKDKIIQHSGFAAVDLDSAEDYDTVLLLTELKKVSCIAYAGLSCRGKRLFAIIPFKYPNLYEKQYERLIKSFEDIGLPMGDDCHKSIAQARFVSWNTPESCFINNNAIPYSLLAPEIKIYPASTNKKSADRSAKDFDAFDWCRIQVDKSFEFITGQRHKYTLRLVRYCNLKGVNREIVTEKCSILVQEDFTITEIQSIIKYVYENHKNSFNKYPFKK